MLSDEIGLEGFVSRCGQEEALRQEADLKRQQIAEDAGQRADNVDARPSQLFQRDQGGARQPPIAVEPGPHSHQCQHLTDRSALVFQIIRPPQHDRDGFRHGQAVSPVACDDALRLLRTVLNGEGAGDAEGIEAVEIAPGRQDCRSAKQIAAGSGPDEAAVERCRIADIS